MTHLSVTQPQNANPTDPGLDPAPNEISATSTRVRTLLELGLEAEELAEALGVKSQTTIRNWAEGSASPRRAGVRAVDDLRRVLVLLGEAGITGDDAAQWLRSRQGGVLENDRPLDVVLQDPVRVLAAANALAEAESD
jgi:transcriptional regulator with XRE-family HTH domain